MDDSIRAFPRPGFFHERGSGSNDNEPQGGMSLRDYFASQAMPALVSRGTYDGDHSLLAVMSYQIADEMLDARKGGE